MFFLLNITSKIFPAGTSLIIRYFSYFISMSPCFSFHKDTPCLCNNQIWLLSFFSSDVFPEVHSSISFPCCQKLAIHPYKRTRKGIRMTRIRLKREREDSESRCALRWYGRSRGRLWHHFAQSLRADEHGDGRAASRCGSVALQRCAPIFFPEGFEDNTCCCQSRGWNTY